MLLPELEQNSIEWRPVVGFEGCYEVSDTGLVRAVKKRAGSTVGKILRPRLVDGYQRVALHNGPQSRKDLLVHRIVARAFIGEPPADKPHINHLDFQICNNHRSNLEYVSQVENNRYNGLMGRMPRGERHFRCRLTRERVLAIRARYERGDTQAALAAEFGMGRSTIGAIVNRQAWQWL